MFCLFLKRYIKFYDVFFNLLFYCSTIECGPYCITPVTFLNKETWKIQDGREYLHNLFSSKSFHICAKKQKIYEWIELLHNLKENSSWKSFCHQNTQEKCNRFSIMIENMWESLKLMTYRLMSLMDVDWNIWYIIHKRFVLIYFSLLHKIVSC